MRYVCPGNWKLLIMCGYGYTTRIIAVCSEANTFAFDWYVRFTPATCGVRVKSEDYRVWCGKLLMHTIFFDNQIKNRPRGLTFKRIQTWNRIDTRDRIKKREHLKPWLLTNTQCVGFRSISIQNSGRACPLFVFLCTLAGSGVVHSKDNSDICAPSVLRYVEKSRSLFPHQSLHLSTFSSSYILTLQKAGFRGKFLRLQQCIGYIYLVHQEWPHHKCLRVLWFIQSAVVKPVHFPHCIVVRFMESLFDAIQWLGAFHECLNSRKTTSCTPCVCSCLSCLLSMCWRTHLDHLLCKWVSHPDSFSIQGIHTCRVA